MGSSIKWPDPMGYGSLSLWAQDLVRTLQNNLSVLPDNPPTGMQADFPGASLPAGWLQTNGSSFNSATWPALFQFLGSTTLPNSVAPIGFIRGIKAQ